MLEEAAQIVVCLIIPRRQAQGLTMVYHHWVWACGRLLVHSASDGPGLDLSL